MMGSTQVAGKAKPAESAPKVAIIDDDQGIREALEVLFQSLGIDVVTYPSTRAFFDLGLSQNFSCMVLDVRMPGESGLELQDRLAAQGHRIPIVFITGHADVPMTVRAMKSGALNFLAKPFRDQELIDAVLEAIRFEHDRREGERDLIELRKLAEGLTAREVDVLKGLDRGLLNKQIAFELGITEITVKMHRSNAFRKLRATTVPDMIQKVRSLNLAQRQ